MKQNNTPLWPSLLVVVLQLLSKDNHVTDQTQQTFDLKQQDCQGKQKEGEVDGVERGILLGEEQDAEEEDDNDIEDTTDNTTGEEEEGGEEGGEQEEEVDNRSRE